ncbi:GNAT family N-acetyltransferase [Muricauda sp. CAU 1633]|uniref:GNAT family N-acetyltransferase n=1 Tax=Allomuricauda sp. CAU 1633 TaxID=2816036 RepID=UPI001A8E70E4|nr:GNAT family N-acetyltransferase [Muricauda sp. CAU 1633]MBO0321983.1 GNAT family N-acetyltransferase [Muricauda sp. CAU 1633]
MSREVILEKVQPSTLDTYVSVGKTSYQEHYLHLWENEDPTPYLSNSFAPQIMQRDLADPNVIHYLVKMGDSVVGIVKLIKNQALDDLSEKESLLAQKIYLLKAYAGMGIGKKVLHLIEDYARKLNKKVIWLDTMQKGGPIQFYQKNGYVIKRESELSLPGAKPSEKAMWILTKRL